MYIKSRKPISTKTIEEISIVSKVYKRSKEHEGNDRKKEHKTHQKHSHFDKQKVKKGFETYFANSTLHGLKYVGDPHISRCERLFWLVSFLTAVIFAVFFIVNLYNKYDRSPVIISFNPKMVKVNEIPFPAITICNVNIALKSWAEFLNIHGTWIHKQLLADMCNKNSSFSNAGNITDEELNTNDFDWDVVQDLIIGMNQKCTEMFKICKWDGTYRYCPNIINTILTDEGYCCSFNKLPVNYSLKNFDEYTNIYPDKIIDWNPEDGYPNNISNDVFPFRSFGPGQNLGLTLVLDAKLNEYYCTTTSSIGFKAIMSTPIESPKMADIGLLISPGEETRIAIDVDIEDATVGVAGIHYAKRQCFFAREKKLRFYRIYTERNCRLECEANFTLKRCGCVPYYLPKDQNTKICGQRRSPCSADAKFIIERFSVERSSCYCLPACYEIKYSAASVTVGKIRKQYTTVDERFMRNVSMEYFAENMAIVHFYFPSDKFPKRTKSEMYGFSEFLSNTGGLLGLFLGFSFLSAVEVFYFLCLSNICKRLTKIYNKQRNNQLIKRNQQQDSDIVYPYVN